MSDNAQMLTSKEVADRLGVHQKTVHLWLRSGKLQGIKISYRAWRIPKESLDSFIDANSNRSAKPGLKTSTGNNLEQKNTLQTILSQDKKEEIITPQSKMKYYIRDIMGEQSSDSK
ncbi:helix-turn-helix domain-containing protein [uncultured Methanoregula sp.]|uniref:helix-turn-helix domain-containing protein n=1 Tax=uncultured Methanoregula sp. TaxID=1005933 RepID=UPI002AAAA9C2|nr:helix-turn-helix domain-containing protein [uncultured Methanoregula sp.]